MLAAAWALITTRRRAHGRGPRDHGAADGADPAAKVKEYAAAIEKALDGFEGKLLIEPGRFHRRASGSAGDARAAREEERQEDVCDYRCGDERPDPSGPVPGVSRDCAGEAAGGRARAVDVVGPVCETGDFFARDRQLAPVEPGDLVALLDAGAYGMAQSSNYNTRMRPAEVLVEGKKRRLIRRRER